MGILRPLIKCLSTDDVYLVRTAAFALINLMRGANPPVDQLLQEKVTDVLKSKISEFQDGIATVDLWTLAVLLAASDSKVMNALVKRGLIQTAIEQLSIRSLNPKTNKSEASILPYIRLLGVLFMTENDKDKCYNTNYRESCLHQLTNALINCSHFESLAVKKESLWVLSNMVAHPQGSKALQPQHIQSVCDRMADKDNDFSERLQAAHVLLNLLAQNENILESDLINFNKIIPVYQELLLSNFPEGVHVALHFLLHVLKSKKAYPNTQAVILPLLEHLAVNSNGDIKHMVGKLLSLGNQETTMMDY